MGRLEIKLLTFGHFEGTFRGAVSIDRGNPTQLVCVKQQGGGITGREWWCPHRANSQCAAAKKVAFVSNSQTAQFNSAEDPSGLGGIKRWPLWSQRGADRAKLTLSHPVDVNSWTPKIKLEPFLFLPILLLLSLLFLQPSVLSTARHGTAWLEGISTNLVPTKLRDFLVPLSLVKIQFLTMETIFL